MLNNGDKLGKYEIGRLLGKGGMGSVYSALDPDLQRNVAIKVMNRKAQGAENALRRFKMEAQAIARLSSPYIVSIYEFNPEAERPYIVMERVDGDSLGEAIDERSPLPLKFVIECARQALTGLSAAHKAGIIHRDIKPANILLSDSGDVKLMDFGLARSLEMESGMTAEGVVVGTIHYLAPEVARGETATSQSDLYSLGITLYEMITGEVPFDEDSPLKLISRIANTPVPPATTLRSDLPPAMAAWLQKMTANDLERRYRSADQALAELAKVVVLCDSDSELYEGSANMATSEVSVSNVKQKKPVNINREEVQKIMARAMEIEQKGQDALDESILMEIAAEVGVSPHAVREAIHQHRQSEAIKRNNKSTAIRVVIAAAAVLLVVGAAFYANRPEEKIDSHYTATGGIKGSRSANNRNPVRAGKLDISTKWKDSGLVLDPERQVLLAKVLSGTGVELRIGDGPAIPCSKTYYGTPGNGKGKVSFRSIDGTAEIAAACVDKIRLAALPFPSGSDDKTKNNLATGAGDSLSVSLASSRCFTVVERVQVDKVIKNLKLEQSGLFDKKTTGRIGKMLGVEYLITGSVQMIGGKARLTAKRINAETGRVLENVMLNGSTNDIFSLQDKLSAELLDRIKASEYNRLLPASEHAVPSSEKVTDAGGKENPF